VDFEHEFTSTFFLRILPETFLILRKIERDMIKKM